MEHQTSFWAEKFVNKYAVFLHKDTGRVQSKMQILT